MNKNIYVIALVTAIIFSGLTVYAADKKTEVPNPSAVSRIIEKFNNEKCGGKTCTKCYQDYTYINETKYYCLYKNPNEKNKLIGKGNCNKAGDFCDEYKDVFKFNRNGKMSSYLYWYADGIYKPVNVKYSYDMYGRIKKEKESDKSTSKILGDTIVTYKYAGTQQEQTTKEHRLDFPPIFKKDKILEQKTYICTDENCKYAQSFLPQIVPVK